MHGFDLSPEELKLFLVEAHEQLGIMEDVLIELEQHPDHPELIQEIFRAAHTLKGGAATIGFDAMATLAHAVESLLDLIRQGERTMTAELGDVLLGTIDDFRRCLDVIDVEGGNAHRFDDVDVQGTIEHIHELIAGEHGDGPAALIGQVQSDHPSEAAATPVHDAVGESIGSGTSVFRLTARITPGTAMPSVRAYQVLLTLDDYGTVVRSDPDRVMIEQESIDVDRIEVIFVPGSDIDQVRQELASFDFLTDVEWLEVREAETREQEGQDAAAREAQTQLVVGQSETQQNAVGESETQQHVVGQSETQQHTVSKSGTHQHGVQETQPQARAKRRPTPSDAPASTGHGLGQTIRINVSLLDQLMNLVGELVIDRTRLVDIETADLPPDALKKRLAEVSSRLSRITSDLQETIMQARMMPVGVLFKKFPRMVRDLSRQLGKEVHLELIGEETELDRSVIEQIGDPLMHLLRNAVDHGIEVPEERDRLGKPRVGQLTLAAEHKEGHIFITVKDDGRGLNVEAIRQKLVSRGIVSAERLPTISDEDVVNMIFLPGLSTAETVSSVSGRGVGMDVVKKNIEKVKGSVHVSTSPGAGTEITIRLPLTLAIIQALLVEVASEVFAIPLSAVTEVVHLDPYTIRSAQGRELFPVRDEMLPLLDPGDVWGPRWAVDWTRSESRPVVIIRAGLSPVGLKVDRLRGEQEVVIKNISPIVGTVPGISGASILGDGNVALIVDPAGFTEALRRQLGQVEN